MNKRMNAYIIGILLTVESALLLIPMLVGFLYNEREAYSCLMAAVISLICGVPLLFLKPRKKNIYSLDGFFSVSVGWILVSMVGALPFTLSGHIPSYLDAVFESVSGFTTTGASILTEVESMGYTMLFWRSFTHWIGGMGVLVFIMAVLPLAGGGGNIFLMRAESPGPDVGKLVPKSNHTARLLYGIYLGMTAILVGLLLLGGLDLFESLTLSFGAAGTGGFAVRSDSIASYSPYIQIVLTLFMALFGVNFNLYFLILCRRWRDALKSEELRWYAIIMAGAILIISLNILPISRNYGDALLASAFSVSSVMTTTGYATVDFNLWPELSRMMLLLVMCVGACAGSTGGGLKVSRIVLMLKSAKKGTKRLAHPRNVSVITFEGKPVDDNVAHGVNVYFIVYMLIFVLSVILVSVDGKDTVSNVTGVIATLNNIGPGLGVIGPTGSFASYGILAKVVFILDMLLGRLELFPLLLMFAPLLRRVKH